jgi:hypothetical protein
MVDHPYLRRIYDLLLSERARHKIERFILIIAIVSFIVHLCLIYLVNLGIIPANEESALLDNAISAIYTPFSFILIYEVYLLVYYLPKSITTYIRKQYEIITLIIIRRLFKDLSTLELSSNWFQDKGDMQFTYDIIASLLLFFLLYLFVRQGRRPSGESADGTSALQVAQFIGLKRLIAAILVPVLLYIALATLSTWLWGMQQADITAAVSLKDINNIFFDEFFTLLIVVDVVLLLISFFYSDQFHKVIRNSGFIISTILIRLSFAVDGLINTILIVSAVIFGLLILYIHNLYENMTASDRE